MSKVTVDGNSLDTKSLLAYIEGGFPQQGIIRDKLYFSGIVGLGYMEQKSSLEKGTTATIFFGTKLNYNLSEKIVAGVKAGCYISNLENVIIGNMFLTYKL